MYLLTVLKTYVLQSAYGLEICINTVTFCVTFGLSDETPYVGQDVTGRQTGLWVLKLPHHSFQTSVALDSQVFTSQ